MASLVKNVGSDAESSNLALMKVATSRRAILGDSWAVIREAAKIQTKV